MCFEHRHHIRVFHKLDEIDNNANIGIEDSTMWKQKIPIKIVTPVSFEPQELWFQVWHSPFWANIAYMWYLGDL